MTGEQMTTNDWSWSMTREGLSFVIRVKLGTMSRSTLTTVAYITHTQTWTIPIAMSSPSPAALVRLALFETSKKQETWERTPA